MLRLKLIEDVAQFEWLSFRVSMKPLPVEVWQALSPLLIEPRRVNMQCHREISPNSK